MRRVTGLLSVGGSLLLAGCFPRLAPADVPAVIASPNPQSHAELLRVVSAAMNGAPVTIAEDALTADDVLIVERARHKDARDMNLSGRESGRPEHFRLVKRGSRCVLVHAGTGRRWTLESATCVPR